MAQDNNVNTQENPRDEDIRKLQDEALKTPGYSDDPHIESSNRSPKNEDINDKDRDDAARKESQKEHGGGL